MSEVYIDNNNYTPGQESPNAYKKGFAITSFVLALVGLLCCFCGLGWILAPLSLIFGIISLATHRGAKGLAIAGVVISSIILALLIFTQVKYGYISDDFLKFAGNADYYAQQYEETGEVHPDFAKYQDPKYDSVWSSMGVKNFDEFYAQIIKSYREQSGGAAASNAAAIAYDIPVVV